MPGDQAMSVRVAYDMTIANTNGAGTGRYAAAAATALATLLGRDFVPIAFPVGATAPAGSVRARGAAAVRDLYWWPHGAPREARRRRANVLHIPAGVGPLHPRLPLVLTLHDLAILRFPHFFRAWSRNYARIVLPRVVAAARAIVTSSDASRQEIIDYFGLPEDRVIAASAGVDPGFSPVGPDSDHARDFQTRYTLPDRFILTVGSVEPRKNLVRLLHALALLRSAGDNSVVLVHAGPAGWLGGDAGGTIAQLGLANAVRFLGYVSRADLPVLYSRATLMAYPSVYEGFGLPVLEAMACGCPVVTSAVSSLPEVAGDAAVFVDPLSVDSITDAVRRVWTDAALRADLRQRGLTRAATFSWDRVAQRIVTAYARALQ